MRSQLHAGSVKALHPSHGQFVTFKGPSVPLKTGRGTYVYNKHVNLPLTSQGPTGMCGSLVLHDCQVCEYDKNGTPSVGNAAAGTPCDDGYYCTYGDACDRDGSCVGGTTYPPDDDCSLPAGISEDCAKVTCDEIHHCQVRSIPRV